VCKRGHKAVLRNPRLLSPPATQRLADNRLKGLPRECRREGNLMPLAPLCPGQAQAAALVEALRSASEAHTGRLLSAVIQNARGEEAAASALLAWVDTAAAGAHKLARGFIRKLVVTVDATLAGLRGPKLGVIQCRRLKPVDYVVACRRHLAQ
jgi:hypothetical protein